MGILDDLPEDERAKLAEFASQRALPQSVGNPQVKAVLDQLAATQEQDQKERILSRIGSAWRRVGDVYAQNKGEEKPFEPQNTANLLQRVGLQERLEDPNRKLMLKFAELRSKGMDAQQAYERAVQLIGIKHGLDQESAAKKAELETEREKSRRAFEEQKLHEQQGFTARENALNRQAATTREETKREAKINKVKAAGYIGPDFEFTDEVPPGSVPDATRAKLMNDSGLVNQVTDSAEKIRGLLRKHGPQVAGKAATEMKALVEDLRLTLKDPVYNLGVLNGKDYELLSTVVSDPTSIKDIVKSATGIRDLDTALRTASERWRSKIVQQMRGFGAVPREGGKYEQTPTVSGSTVQVRWKGTLKEIPTERLQEALAEGAEQVQ